jgi:hypothetical protein
MGIKSAQTNLPFDFVFDYLLPLEVSVRPLFGLFAVYAGEKILLILRQRKSQPEINGVWIATKKEYHKSLKKDLPSLCPVVAYANVMGETEWQMLPASATDFETAAIKICSLILRGDPRIGRLPKPRPKTRKKT